MQKLFSMTASSDPPEIMTDAEGEEKQNKCLTDATDKHQAAVIILLKQQTEVTANARASISIEGQKRGPCCVAARLF